MNKIKEFFKGDTFKKLRKRVPLGVVIGICVLPVLLTILFYILRLNESIMYWVAVNISTPIRGFMALISSVYPFSITEILLTFAVIWLIYYLIKTISIVSRKREKLKVLSKRILLVFVLSLYAWSIFSWLWSSGYHATGFAKRNNLTNDGVAIEELIALTQHFAEKANEFAPEVKRNSTGSFHENRNELFTTSTTVYKNIAAEFPELNKRLFRPKPMLYSWLMSRTAYSGMYFALTGEANINNMIHGSILPSTLAHEQAHHLGIFSEDEANLVSILACIQSDDVVFAYSGYIKGLNYLLSALYEAEVYIGREAPETALEINYIREEILESLAYEVKLDRWENYEFWQSQKTVDTGVGFVDTALTAVTDVVKDTVDTAYDGYLKAQRQELGIRSYGACVDLLVEYYKTNNIINIDGHDGS